VVAAPAALVVVGGGPTPVAVVVGAGVPVAVAVSGPPVDPLL